MRAKRYMSDDSEYQYVGTVTSWKVYKSVVNDPPKVATKTTRSAKVTHNAKVLKELRKVLDGPFKDQFAGRLDDAIAVAGHNWEHFSNSIGEIPAARRALPAQLAVKMLRAGKRQPKSSATETSATSGTSVATPQPQWMAAGRPPPMRQRVHMMKEVNGFARGPGVQLAAAFGGHQPRTVEEFRLRPVAVGAFVVTKAAPQARVEKHARNSARGASGFGRCCTCTNLERLCRPTPRASCIVHIRVPLARSFHRYELVFWQCETRLGPSS